MVAAVWRVSVDLCPLEVDDRRRQGDHHWLSQHQRSQHAGHARLGDRRGSTRPTAVSALPLHSDGVAAVRDAAWTDE